MKLKVDGKLKFGWSLPPMKGASIADWVALLVGTGLGSGGFRPAPGTWGSVVGFGYAAALFATGNPIACAVITVLVLILSVPACARCEKLFNKPDPGSVVIDEIACVPLAIWPAWGHSLEWWQWGVVFVCYRIMDILKPFPANRADRMHGGVGIMLDDVISSTYMGLIWYFGREWLFKH